MRRLLLASLVVGLTGCVYYNGMYNANRLAGRAESAERDGRTLDAGNYWSQVMVKADSVLARHPDSKWADDARLLRARALARTGQCEAAIPELAVVQIQLTQPELVEQAGLDLGRCRLQTGDVAGARVALVPVAASRDADRQALARRLLGQASLADRDFARALELFEGRRDSAAASDRLVALAGAGRLDEARSLADTLIAGEAASVTWGAFLQELGRADPAAASAYLARLDSLDIPRPKLAGWYLEDAGRRLPTDRAAALQQLLATERIAPQSEAAVDARLRRARLLLGAVRVPESLDTVILALRGTGDETAGPPSSADQLLMAAEVVSRTADSVDLGTPQGDLMLFLAAEVARDSLRAPELAARLMRRVAEEWPESPYAPKALLALISLDRGTASGVRSDLETLYGASPYVAVAYGLMDSTYHVLEDSLGTFAANWRAARSNRPAPGRDIETVEGREPVPADRPGVEPALRRPADRPASRPGTRPGVRLGAPE